ncbi:MAG: A/G-specific adenine glycosylase [Bacteroidota bacterium]|nr:A/G-specific adenine glycosylase [Bacteroidota bacterium]
MSTTSFITNALEGWYAENKRDLPWRTTRDPYKIWLSEVILQQTRVDQGTAYWHRFVERFPTVDRLAAAPEDEVLKLWQGLGYYSRARNLLFAARQIVEHHKGIFPGNYIELRALKGVGDYTAAAIGSICFNLPEAVLDGNVFRVLARVYGISLPIDSAEGRQEFRSIAARSLDRNRPGDHNQAMMELGATVCTPKLPKCPSCPIKQLCVAFRDDRINELPVKAGKTKVRTRHFNYLVIENGDALFLRKRVEKDIWQNLYELPLIETARGSTALGMKVLIKTQFGGSDLSISMGEQVSHILSHQLIKSIFWKVNGKLRSQEDWISVPITELDNYALPRLIDRWINEHISIKEMMPTVV